MKTAPRPTPTSVFASPVYYQLVHTLTGLLPPPVDDSPGALHTRNHAAIARVAALLPVNADEADLAAHCIAARAQAENLLLLLRQNAGDIQLVMRLNAQYGSMIRTSLSVHGRLMRVQALRQKRDSIDGAAKQDAWALHIAERSMLRVLSPDSKLPEPAWPEPAAPPPEANPDQTTQHPVSETNTNSHEAAFETSLSAQSRNPASRLSGETDPPIAMANTPQTGQKSPPNGQGRPTGWTMAAIIAEETAST